ncbi:hypothetical protein RND81_02G027500 [Saponaria officinalis]|uniref:Uncharacterized protein n=1 Tax=Saponaria officinalis TaxID=3572 RepID=A0AAW1MQC6_SAPOF
MAALHEDHEEFIEIQVNADDFKHEHPYNLSMAECLGDSLYFTVSRLDDDVHDNHLNNNIVDYKNVDNVSSLQSPRVTFVNNLEVKKQPHEYLKKQVKSYDGDDGDEEEEEEFWYMCSFRKFKRCQGRSKSFSRKK